MSASSTDETAWSGRDKQDDMDEGATAAKTTNLNKKSKNRFSNLNYGVTVRLDPEKQVKQEEKDARTIFVGNLPSDIERRSLRKFFIDCGEIESVRLRGLVPEKPNIPRKVAAIKKDKIHEICKSIYGYVVFRSSDSVEKALKLGASRLEGRFISVQRVGQTTYDQNLSVFCGNLPLIIQENALHEFFHDCGSITGVRVVRDNATGAGKGFAFVAFESRDGVELALEKNGGDICGRPIRIMRAGQKLDKKELPKHVQNAIRRIGGKEKKKEKKKERKNTKPNSKGEEREKPRKVKERGLKERGLKERKKPRKLKGKNKK